MKIHEFGKRNQGNIVMIHGACMSWDMLLPSIKFIAKKYHIYTVSVLGHDLTTNEEFTSVENISTRLERAFLLNEISRIDLT